MLLFLSRGGKVLNRFIKSLTDKGLAFDEDLLRNQYNALPPLIRKKARTILLPICAENGVVYGMDNISGDAVPFSFSRASQATMFDANLDMKLVANNTPRIDFANYDNAPKILIEKESTNLLLDSDFELGIDDFISKNVQKIDFDWKGSLLSSKAFRLGADISSTSAVYKKYTLNTNDIITYSVFATKEGSIPKMKYVGYSSHNFDAGFSTNSFATVITPIPNTETATAITTFRKENVIRCNVSFISTQNVINGVNGIGKRASQITDDYIYLSGYQLEAGTTMTSYIPTADAVATRAADKLSIALTNNASVYLYSTKQKKVMDKTAGTWQIADELDNEGIYSLAIFESVLTDNEKQSLTI